MICSIICGAPCESLDELKRLAEGFIIAADRGIDYCAAAGIKPDLAVGDFDSASSLPSGVECVRVSPIKDDTDAALAAEIAVERSFGELRFLCALGGRLDHSIANIQLLYSLKEKGVRGELYGGGARAFFAVGESVSIPKNGGYLSVFAYGETAEVSETGVKYPLDRKALTNNFPLGVSNEITADFAVVSVHSGAALIILTDKD